MEERIRDEQSQPWYVTESGDVLELCHDHRWLKIIGLPFALMGLVLAGALWFLPGVDYSEAWPMIAVGSLMGLALTLMGLHLSFNRELFIADKREGQLVHQTGFGSFSRTRRYPLEEIRRVVCDRVSSPGSRGGSYAMVIEADSYSLRIAVFVEADPVLLEALRWSEFLGKPFVDRSDWSRRDRLAQRFEEHSRNWEHSRN